jgi:hypothetical protein
MISKKNLAMEASRLSCAVIFINNDLLHFIYNIFNF